MAGFFSLSSGTGSGSDQHNNNPPKQNTNNNPQNQQAQGWYLYRNPDDDQTTIQQQQHPSSSNYYHVKESGYDLWPQLQQQHLSLYHPSAVGLGIRTADGVDHETGRSDGSPDNYNRMMMLRRMNSTGSTGSGSTSGVGVGSISCQDCGNQAKKDCIHMRCRTCCKSRGFDCVTHIKSTWVPASVRRNRNQTVIAETQEDQPQSQSQLGLSKRRRENPITASSSSSLVCTQLPIATTTATTTTTTTAFAGMELGNFPAEVSSPAVFRCVRVSSVDDTEEEVAYQTAVNIGGHVFKGILYDHGPDQHLHQQGTNRNNRFIGGSSGGGESSSGGGPSHDIATGATTSRTGPPSSVTIAVSSPVMGYLDQSLYPASFSSYIPPGTQFFPNPRP